MSYLLDTHALIWSIVDKNKLSGRAQSVLEDPSNKIFVSSVTYWEISLKFALGKLDLEGLSPADFPDLASQMGFTAISLEAGCAATYYQLQTTHHKDPFDRMLIWQAIQNKMILVTNDGNMPYYVPDGLRLLW